MRLPMKKSAENSLQVGSKRKDLKFPGVDSKEGRQKNDAAQRPERGKEAQLSGYMVMELEQGRWRLY